MLPYLHSVARLTLILSYSHPLVDLKVLMFSTVAAFTILAYDVLLDLSREVGKMHVLVYGAHLIDSRQYKYIWR